MKTYVSVFRLRMLNGLQYRVAALAGLSTQFFWGFMYIMIFEAFYHNAITSPPIDYDQLVTYIWLQQAFLALVSLWIRDPELFHLITSGNIAYELCLPSNIYRFWYAKVLGQRLSSALLRCFPILIIASILPDPYRFIMPPDFLTLILFSIALILGLFVIVAISMLIYISVFVTLNPTGSILIFGIVGEFFAGLIIPIPFMPTWLQKIAYVLPFRYTADLPFRVYSGNIPVHEAIQGIGIQLIWLTLLFILGQYAMNKALQRVIVQGG